MKRFCAELLLLALTLSACAGAPEAADVQESPFTWSISVSKAEKREALHTDAGVQQYDGSILGVAYDEQPSDGCVFVILTMTVTKNRSGANAFRWENLTLTSADGTAYARMEDDSFLSLHTYRRMPATDLMIGENKGSICFELPEAQASSEPLTLRYDAGDEGIIQQEITF